MAEKVTVVLDINEPTVVQEAFENHKDVEEVKVALLEAGDISIGNVGFERKDITDFVNTMKDEDTRSFEDQTQKLAKGYDHAYVLFEGDLSDADSLLHSDMNPASIRGQLASLTARERYPVRAAYPCSNTALLADMAVRLARKHTEEPSSPHLPTGVVGKSEPVGKQLWGCFSNVGPEIADRLFEEFGPPTYFTWTDGSRSQWEEKLQWIDGIGEEKAKQIAEEMWVG